jgi:hypothetical protein
MDAEPGITAAGEIWPVRTRMLAAGGAALRYASPARAGLRAPPLQPPGRHEQPAQRCRRRREPDGGR